MAFSFSSSYSSSNSQFMALLTLCLMVIAVAGEANDTHDHEYISPSSSYSTERSDGICDRVECGRGKCKKDDDYQFNFRCECDDGWRRTLLPGDDDDLKFLPCTIPTCSFDYSCLPSLAAPISAIPLNSSAGFDPCTWAYCGEGRCRTKRDESYRYRCDCHSDYDNLLDIPFFPCYGGDCDVGSDCERFGIRTSGSRSSRSHNEATSSLPGKFLWAFILLVSVLAVLWI